MLTFLVLFSFIDFELTAGDSGALLFHPKVKCVPTATIRGPRHACVCYVDGVYHCQPLSEEKTDNTSDTTETTKPPGCEPDQQYREGSTLCSCTNAGQWRSTNCRDQFHRLVLRKDSIRKNIQTDITCKPGSLYTTDCNVCSCQNTSVINFSSCTTRSCPKRLKTDSCVQGEVYRTNNEFCFCSFANFYVDTFCIKVGEGVMEEIEETSLAGLYDNVYLHPEISVDKCDTNVSLYFDCNTCTCYQNTYLCTSRLCYDDEPALRVGKIVIEQLPELKSQRNKCVPGLKYKYKCNTCICNGKGQAICTSMICLTEVVLNEAALRQTIVSY